MNPLHDHKLCQDNISAQKAPYRPKVDLTEVMKRLRFFGVQNMPLFKSLHLYNFFAFLVCIFSNEKDPAKKQDFVQVFGTLIYINFAYPVTSSVGTTVVVSID